MAGKRDRWIMLAILLALVAAVLIVGFRVRQQQLALEKAGAVRLIVQGRETVIPLSRLDRETYTKEVINVKGESRLDTYRGIEVRTLLTEYGYNVDQVSGMTVTAADQYSAEYSGDEIREPERICLAVRMNDREIEGAEPGQPGVLVIAFGDPNMKRMIRNPVTLEVK